VAAAAQPRRRDPPCTQARPDPPLTSRHAYLNRADRGRQ
jgi:hypothetical protein